MDSDRNSNQFLGSRRVEAQNWPVKTLPLMDRTSFLPMLLFIFVVADVSNASHRFLIDDPPKVNSDISTASGKDSPVASPPPPPDAKVVKPLSNDVKNKTEHVMPAKTPDPNPDPNNPTKTVNVAPPTDTGDGKNNQTSKDPAPVSEKPKKDPAPEPEKPKKKDPAPEPEKPKKKDPAPEPEKPKKEEPAPEPEKPKKDPAPEPEKKPGSASPPRPPLEGGKEGAPEIEKTKKSDNVSDTSNVSKESCDGEIKTCRNSDMVACIVNSNSESTEVVILVQNLRDSTLKGNVSAEGSTPLVIRKHKSEKIKLNVGKSNKIVVKAGNEECVLQMDPFVSEGNFFMRFPSYEKVVTPINGAYFLIVTVIIFGGMWACCLIRRRKQRTGGGVPYQELEMALPESAAATEEVTAEGWDQGWDDDWDGDNAVKPGGHLVGSISANGLTARSSNKDGWENNWDD